MRTLLSLVAVSLLASAAASSHDADACGVYMMSPAVFRIVMAPKGDRAFVLSRADATASEEFEPLAPMSYDPTEIAPHAPLPRAVPLTLLGEHATRKVTTDRAVLVRNHRFEHGDQMLGLEVPFQAGARHDFTIAVSGTHRDLGWTPIVNRGAIGDGDKAFLAANKIDVAGAEVERMPVTDKLVALVYYDAKLGDYRVALRAGETLAGSFVGMPMGVLAADGQHHLVVDNKGIAHAYIVYA